MMKDSMKPGYGRRDAVTTTVIRLLIILCMVLFLGACAQTRPYSVDIEYMPPLKTSATDEKVKNLSITVAKFNDLRKMDDKMVIGKVVKSDGTKILILPKHHMPADAVTRAVKLYLSKAGYNVSNQIPDWNLNDDAIENEWGNIVIGGDIHEFELVCFKEMPVRKYKAKVTLTEVNVESSPSLEHVRFTEGKMAEVINDALAAAINKIFESQKVNQKIKEIAGEK